MIPYAVNVSIRHQTYLEGLKVGKQGDLAASLAKLQAEIVGLISTVSYDDLGQMRKLDLNLLLMQMQKASQTIFSGWLTNLIQWLKDYIDVDCDFWQFALTEMKVANAPEDQAEETRNRFFPIFGKFNRDKIYSTAKNMPMGANGVLMEQFANAFTVLSTAKLMNEVSKAYANSDTKQDTLKAIIGTKEAKYKDGLLETLRRQGDAMTNTIIQHVAGQTNEAVSSQAFGQYLWVSVLDSGTTKICRSRNGHVFTYGQGPTPPAHIGCRSSIIAFDGTGPVTMPSFTVWANGQSKEFVNDAFDGEDVASYEGSKAISLSEFAGKRSLILA